MEVRVVADVHEVRAHAVELRVEPELLRDGRALLELRLRAGDGVLPGAFEPAASKNFANFWRARSRLYQNERLQENMRLTAFFKLYKICILLHRCNLKILAKKSV